MLKLFGINALRRVYPNDNNNPTVYTDPIDKFKSIHPLDTFKNELSNNLQETISADYDSKNPFQSINAFKIPHLSMSAGAKRRNLSKWNTPLEYDRKIKLPDEEDIPNFLPTDYSKFTKMALPYISIIKRANTFSLALTNAMETLPTIDNELILIPITKIFDNKPPNGKSIIEKFPLLTNSQINTLILYLSRSGDYESLKVLGNCYQLDMNICDDENRSALTYACIGGHLKCVDLLLKLRANVESMDKYGRTPLLHASYFGHLECVKLLLKSNADITATDYHCRNALHHAIYSDNSKLVKLLLYEFESIKKRNDQKSLSLLYTDKEGITPLMWAAYLGKTDHAKILSSTKQQKKLFFAQDINGFSVLHWASKNRHIWAIKSLISKSRDLLLMKDKFGCGCLHLAAGEGNTLLIEYYLSAHPKLIDIQDFFKRTPLHFASANGHLTSINCLIRFGADINIQDSHGSTPLHYACQQNFVECVHFLLKRGADKNIQDINGRNPLIWAFVEENIDTIQILNNEETDLDVYDNDGLSPLHISCINGDMDSLSFALIEGAQINQKCTRGCTPLSYAVMMGWADIVLLLLESGSNVDETDYDDRTPLHLAASCQLVNIISILLENGASIDIPDNNGRFPIHIAADCGNEEIILMLLKEGSTPHAYDESGMTPLHLACDKQHFQCCLALLENGAALNSLDWSEEASRNIRTALDIAISSNNKEIIELLESMGGFTGATIRNFAVVAIQKFWRAYWIKKITKELPQLKELVHKKNIRQIRAAIKIQAWFRCKFQRRMYVRKLKLKRMTAVRDYEVLLTIKELNKAVQDREIAAKESQQASEDLRSAEMNRLDAMNKKKSMIELNQKIQKEYKEQPDNRKPFLKGSLRSAAAIVIQNAWKLFKQRKLKNSEAITVQSESRPRKSSFNSVRSIKTTKSASFTSKTNKTSENSKPFKYQSNASFKLELSLPHSILEESFLEMNSGNSLSSESQISHEEPKVLIINHPKVQLENIESKIDTGIKTIKKKPTSKKNFANIEEDSVSSPPVSQDVMIHDEKTFVPRNERRRASLADAGNAFPKATAGIVAIKTIKNKPTSKKIGPNIEKDAVSSPSASQDVMIHDEKTFVPRNERRRASLADAGNAFPKATAGIMAKSGIYKSVINSLGSQILSKDKNGSTKDIPKGYDALEFHAFGGKRRQSNPKGMN